MPALKALIPLAKSPIRRGIFPAPNRRTMIAKTTIQCIRLNEPMTFSRRMPLRRQSSTLAPRPAFGDEHGLRKGQSQEKSGYATRSGPSGVFPIGSPSAIVAGTGLPARGDEAMRYVLLGTLGPDWASQQDRRIKKAKD